MNGYRQAFLFLSRRISPIRSSNCLLNNRPLGVNQRLQYSSDTQNEDDDEFPKLPLLSPLKTTWSMMKKKFQMIEFLHQQQGIKLEVVETLDNTVNEVLKFVTKCLREENFDILEEKFTPEALQKARNIMASLPEEKKKLIEYEELTSNFLFARGLSAVVPWKWQLVDNSVHIHFVGIAVQHNRQSIWILTLSFRKEDSSLSEDFQVTDIFFENFDPSEADETEN